MVVIFVFSDDKFDFVGIRYKEVKWDWNVKCLDDKIGIKSQSRSSSCFVGFMKGRQKDYQQ